MKHFLIILFIFLFLLISHSAFAFQFEDFYWGQTKGEILDLLKENNKEDVNIQTNERISYSDEIYQQPCKITMIFTFENYELAAVFIEWETGTIGDEIQKELIDRYGQPVELESYMKEYRWQGGFPGERLILDYLGNAELSYYGGKYYQKYQKQLHAEGESEL